MKLYYSPGACSLASHIALRETGRDFELHRVDLKTHRTADGGNYYAINPKGYVPALELDGELFTESPVVLQQIADVAPDRELAPPPGTLARVRLLEWLCFFTTELHKVFGPLFAPETPPPMMARNRGKLAERFEYLEGVMVDRGYVIGDTYTVADSYLYAMLRWCERVSIDRQVWPNLDAYFLKINDRPATQLALGAEGLLETHHFRRVG